MLFCEILQNAEVILTTRRNKRYNDSIKIRKRGATYEGFDAERQPEG
jgi:hypothetical protein